MKREFFFWLEKLRIGRAERRAVSLLMLLLVALVLVNAVITPSHSFGDGYYRSLDKAFQKRAAQMHKKHQQLMARYQGRSEARRDSLPADTAKSHPPAKSALASDLINVNTASSSLLQQLHGIGPAYAQRIIDYRKKNGSFKTKEALVNVKGIGKKRLARIKPFIKLKEQP